MTDWNEFYDRGRPPFHVLHSLAVHMPLFLEVLAGQATRLLEVGVGTGEMSRFLAFVGCQVTGIDNDRGVLDRAGETGVDLPGLEYHALDAARLSTEYAPNTFDAAFSQGFFEHFDDDTIRSLCAEQLSVATRVVFSVPSRWYPQQDFGDERLMTAAQWEEILRPIGVVSVGYYDHLPTGPVTRILYRLAHRPRPGRHLLITVERMGRSGATG